MDLHTHSRCSDGALTPSELVAEAARRGLAAVALTDHDSIDGLEEALAAGTRLGVQVIPGVELTASWDGRRACHLLGYFIDHRDQALQAALADARLLARAWTLDTIERINALGLRITAEEVLRENGRGAGGVPLLLRILERGGLRGHPAAFGILALLAGEPRAFSAAEAIRLIHGAGGAAVLAHPGTIRRRDPLQPDEAILPLVEAGLDGIEVWTVAHHPERVVPHYQQQAARLGLVATGGSDFHGPRPDGHLRLGRVPVPYSVVEALRAARARRLAGRPPGGDPPGTHPAGEGARPDAAGPSTG